MEIRRANDGDTDAILNLLSQVLELHAKIRPDIFVSGTTKYTRDELSAMFSDDEKPVLVAVEGGAVIGYAFCVLKKQPFSTNMVPFTSMFIDDLCVDEKARGRGAGKALFEAVKAEAKKRGCYDITLNVWEGNDSARAFYDKQKMRVKETQMEFIL